MGNIFQFYRDEREEHRCGLGEYAAHMKHVSPNDNPLSEFVKYVDPSCDNINLVVDNRGGWCHPCQHYHFKYATGWDVMIMEKRGVHVGLGQELRCHWNPAASTNCMSFGNQPGSSINPGKYRSDFGVDTPADNRVVVKKVRAPREPRQKSPRPVPHLHPGIQLIDTAIEESEKECRERFADLF